jgi:hypothetical protein
MGLPDDEPLDYGQNEETVIIKPKASLLRKVIGYTMLVTPVIIFLVLTGIYIEWYVPFIPVGILVGGFIWTALSFYVAGE